MESANGITRQQAEDEMQLFKKVFTVGLRTSGAEA